MNIQIGGFIYAKEAGQVRLKQIERGQQAYRRYIREAVYGLWAGAFNEDEFISLLYETVRAGFTAAWHAGAKEMGIQPDELTVDERQALRGEMTLDFAYIVGFAAAIEAGSKANQGKLAPLMRRAELWMQRYLAVRNHAKQMAARDRKLKWVMHPLKEHCPDCLRLNGRVYRASTWGRYGLEPQSHDLQCGGWRCGCEFVPTDERATGGRPPRIGG